MRALQRPASLASLLRRKLKRWWAAVAVGHLTLVKLAQRG
jgi:hypothetical protein